MAKQYHQFKLLRRFFQPGDKDILLTELADAKIISVTNDYDITSNLSVYCVEHKKPLIVRSRDKTKHAFMVPHEGKAWTILSQREDWSVSYFCNNDRLTSSIGFPFEAMGLTLTDDYLQETKKEAEVWINSIGASVLMYWLKSEGEPDWGVAVRHEDMVAVKWLWKQGYLNKEALEARLSFFKFLGKSLPSKRK